jgi:hypothetical protein
LSFVHPFFAIIYYNTRPNRVRFPFPRAGITRVSISGRGTSSYYPPKGRPGVYLRRAHQRISNAIVPPPYVCANALERSTFVLSTVRARELMLAVHRRRCFLNAKDCCR